MVRDELNTRLDRRTTTWQSEMILEEILKEYKNPEDMIGKKSGNSRNGKFSKTIKGDFARLASRPVYSRLFCPL
jgi:hypothetical protein